ncbi:MAG: hypothetical protein ACK4WH_15615, partial [Phycisphaerales bacterium]
MSILWSRSAAVGRAVLLICALALLPALSVGQPRAGGAPAAPAQSVPASRAAKNVAVITIRGEIDNWTAFGVDRRIKRAISDGADA